MNLKGFSDEQLLQELEDRKRNAKPEMIQDPDIDLLKYTCQQYIDHLHSKGREMDTEYINWCQIIFEMALETFYGKDIFKWVNQWL